MNRTITAIFFCLAFGITVFGQSAKPSPSPAKPAVVPAAPQLPTVDQILDKFIEASGGKAAMNKLNSRISKGTVEIPAANITGTLEGYDKAPNKSFVTVTLPGIGNMQNGYDGTAGWAVTPQEGLKDLKDADLTNAAREADFYKTLRLKEHYPKMVLKGKEKLGEREAYVIEATPAAGGSPEKMYFDVQTGLVVRIDLERDTAQGKMSITNEFDDYKEVDGVKIPMTTRQLFPSFSMIYRITEVKHNEPIDDSKFAKPVIKAVP